MNPVLRAAAEAITVGWVLGFMTIVFIVFFLGWVWYVYRPSNKARFEEMARLPFEDGGDA